MIQRPLSDISLEDLQALIDNDVAEGRDLEFKRDLPGDTKSERKEFIADITSLANAQGGDLLFGVEDAKAKSRGVVGVISDDPDKLILGLENMLRDMIEPRLGGVRMRWIPLSEARGVLIIRVPGSVAAPHRGRNHGHFSSRNSRGKYELDIDELRRAFIDGEALPAKLRQLHAIAVAGAQGNEMPFRLTPGPGAVVSIVPLAYFRERRDLEITHLNALAPYKPGGMSAMHTLEGVLLHGPLSTQNTVKAYALTHTAGRTDAAWSIGRAVNELDHKPALVWPQTFEAGVIDAARSTVVKFREQGLEGPWAVFASAFGLKDHSLVLGDYDTSSPAWRDRATLAELIVEEPSDEALSPIFRALWLMFGELRPSNRPVGV